jgi:chorismate mutase
LQKARWEEVLSRIIKKGRGKNFDENFIKDIWERIHEESLKIEEK